jgi:hypothetical protein
MGQYRGKVIFRILCFLVRHIFIWKTNLCWSNQPRNVKILLRAHMRKVHHGVSCTLLLLNVAAHNVSIRNVKVSKCERHITYSVTKRIASQNVKCKLCNAHFMFVTVYDLWLVRYVTFTFWKLYVLDLLGCVQLRFVTLRHVTSTLCCFMLCSNISCTPNTIHLSI